MSSAHIYATSVICVVLAMVGVSGQTPAGGLSIERVFGPEVPTGPYKHPACLTELDNGDLYLVYYGGEGEYARDTAVFGSRLRRAAALDAAAGRSRATRSDRSATASSGRRPTAWSGSSTSSATARRGPPRASRPRSRATTPRPGPMRSCCTRRGDDGPQPADRAARRRLPAAGLPRDRRRHRVVGADSTSLFLRYQKAQDSGSRPAPSGRRRATSSRPSSRSRPGA